jgi:lysophospholipase L1-like esterase
VRVISIAVVRRAAVGVRALLLALVLAGCAAAPVPGTPGPTGAAPAAALAGGPVTVIALGDSLTAGDGDDAGKGFVGRLTEAIAARPGRQGSTLTNLGQSGWDSTMMVNGYDGGPQAQLPQAVAAARAAAPGAVLATVLIGSNDLWYVYQNGAVEPTPRAEEDAMVAAYRANLERTLTELQAAGAVVVVGLPDDQSARPIAGDMGRLHQQLSAVTAEEVGKMSTLAGVLDRTAAEVAAAHGAPTVDTNDPFWADPARMADDGIHPNAAGYTALAELWTGGVAPLLGA